MSRGNTGLNAKHLMDVDVIPCLGSLLNTIHRHRVLVIPGLLGIRQWEWQFGYTCKMRMRILVQDGVRRKIGIQRGLLLGVDRIGLATGSVTTPSRLQRL